MSSRTPVWVVIPTYNERENIQRVIKAVLAQPVDCVVIVDDASPDGTGQAAEVIARAESRLRVLHRAKKDGLGRAYQAGFRYALEGGAGRVIQMDGDLSHDPALIPSLLERLENYDLVIASRYVAGGELRIDLKRKWISTIGNSYIRWLLGDDIHDWSTGYKAWRGKALRSLLDQPSEASGYAWLMEMNWHARLAGARISEVPMIFTDRVAGKSKFSLAIVLEDIKTAWKLSRR